MCIEREVTLNGKSNAEKKHLYQLTFLGEIIVSVFCVGRVLTSTEYYLPIHSF
jgi:hypothetical protein